MKNVKLFGKIVSVFMLIFLMVWGIVTLQEFATKPRDSFLQGQIEARRVLVAGKIPGRIETLLFKEGDAVEKNSILAIISSPEIEAKKMQVNGALEAARAQANKAKNGARPEDIAAAKAMAERAQEAADLAEITYKRVQKLYDDGVLPLQKRDEAETQMKASKAAASAAKATYNQALAGARREDKAAANALVKQAQGANAEVNAYLDETKIHAPITGEISLKFAEEGEIVGAGSPIFAITDLNDSWAIFHLREDFLKNISKGKFLTVFIPALDQKIEMEVTYIASVGDYATWHSSKESSGFDLKTFEIRLRPKMQVENLRPGMTVLLSPDSIR